MTVHVLWVIVHSLAVVVFVNRYIAGIILRLSRGKNWDETRDDYEPTVTAVTPPDPGVPLFTVKIPLTKVKV